MGCCGSSTEKPKGGDKDGNNEYEKIERNDSKLKTVLTGIIVGMLIIGLVIWMI